MDLFNLDKCGTKDILNGIASPFMIAETMQMLDGYGIEDFKLVFFNDAFCDQVANVICECDYYHEMKAFLSPELPLLDMVDKAANGVSFEPVTYFSPVSDSWFRVNVERINESYVLINLCNVTNEKTQAKRLNEIAYIDVLTGLKNKSKFNEDAAGILAQAYFSETKAGFLLINLSNMKNINNFNGRFLGDEVLRKCAQVLNRFAINAVESYRYEGDEFIIVIKDRISCDSIINACDAILEAFITERINISGGLAVYPDDSSVGDDLLRFADIAMHYARHNEKNIIVRFNSDMQRVFVQNCNMQTKMATAVMKGDFYLMYQPQFDIGTGNLHGFEALIRWHDNDMGEIGPAIFIPMAEASGLILEIGEWVLETAFSTLKKWQIQYNFKGVLSVNISPIQLKKRNFLGTIRSLVEKYKVNPCTVELEITEGTMIDNINDAIDKMKELKRMGFNIALDDFGTGYSSLSYLQVLPLDTLKVDKAFVNDICARDGVQSNITNFIINMGTKMGLKTIAEGVERPEQLAILKEYGCHIVQGFLRGKPMHVSNCDAYLNGNKAALVSLENEAGFMA